MGCTLKLCQVVETARKARKLEIRKAKSSIQLKDLILG